MFIQVFWHLFFLLLNSSSGDRLEKEHLRNFQLSAYVLGQIPGDFCQKIQVTFIGHFARSLQGNFSGVYVASKMEFTNNGKTNIRYTNTIQIANYLCFMCRHLSCVPTPEQKKCKLCTFKGLLSKLVGIFWKPTYSAVQHSVQSHMDIFGESTEWLGKHRPKHWGVCIQV